MRPLKMTMTAFGPYRDHQKIDFSEIKDYQLFVISGKTGAGKTTIFDALCFAIYGEANGEDRRETRLLRSDFADDETYTSVELDFELRGRQYRVIRELPHVKEGRKTASGGKAELYEITTGTPIPFLDKFYKREVDRSLVELVGLDKDQFSQIVMLPQGEFRKLLTSETDNKEQILRRIFKTDSFKMITEALDRRRRAAMDKAREKRGQLDLYIEQISTTLERRDDSELFATLAEEHYSPQQVIHGLAEEIQFYLGRGQAIKQQLDQADATYKQKEAALHAAKALNERFALLESYQSQSVQLEQRQAEMKEQEGRLRQAEKASFIEPYEQQFLTSQEQARQRKGQFEQKTNALQAAQTAIEQAEQFFQQEAEKETAREQAKRQVQQLAEWAPAVAKLAERKQHLLKQRHQLQHIEQQLEQREAQMKTLQTNGESLKQMIRQAEEQLEQLPVWQKKQMDAAAREKLLKQHLDNLREAERLRQQEATEASNFKQLHTAYEQLEADWLAGQASMLAQSLQAGDPCPVCGSHDHPEKAGGGEGEGQLPTKEQLDELREKRDRQSAAQQRVGALLAALRMTMQQEREQIGQVEDIASAYEQAKRAHAEATAALQQLEQTHRQLTHNRSRFTELEAQLTEQQTEQEAERKKHQALQVEYSTEVAVLKNDLQAIPEQVRELEQLQAKLREAKQASDALEASWKQAQETRQQAQIKLTRAESEQQSASNALQEAEQQQRNHAEVYEREWKLAEFETEQHYQAAKLDRDRREQLRQEIETYKTKLHTARTQLTEIQSELAGKQRQDLEQLSAEVNQWEIQRNQYVEDLHRAQRAREDAVKLKDQISRLYAASGEAAQEAQMIVHLHDLVRGDNEYRLSFERYLQIAYLESIIEAANVRLQKMTNGQFQLDRRADREARGRQSGLGLDVLDAYTGQYRDVKSLSGGEKFKASLCLALGLSDVIQAHDGGISIETMFIDEGFGSLDEESLQEAVDILVELQQSGRTIGVISHVQELKDAIPAVLEVQKTREGYSQAQFIIR
ncbi:hypothetical protein BEP19_08965 [Ammoniphilus oxalaticus]|uniref:Nuclease SbcCD subunit C n=1 Tax=Ammoniphilus oxalaticus TaxID=66863 RepID=A0A419SKJ4_9BACL|nr:SMC family ATPase [Ammoniphilus oxalaticus]RKD24505.1 hypothetical protein BEP19_08965 [Ammoniphilus oxalaticus]